MYVNVCFGMAAAECARTTIPYMHLGIIVQVYISMSKYAICTCAS